MRGFHIRALGPFPRTLDPWFIMISENTIGPRSGSYTGIADKIRRHVIELLLIFFFFTYIIILDIARRLTHSFSFSLVFHGNLQIKQVHTVENKKTLASGGATVPVVVVITRQDCITAETHFTTHLAI